MNNIKRKIKTYIYYSIINFNKIKNNIIKLLYNQNTKNILIK